MLTAALNEPGAALPDRPATTFVHSRLSGTKVGVGYAENAEWMLVTADSAVVVVSPKADGVQISKTPTSNGSDEYAVTFSDVAVADDDVLTGATAQRVNQLALAAIGAYTAGLVAGALRLTADYVANRQQFGKPLSTFQTVAAQLAEVYIASRTIDLASTSVIWRLAEGRDASRRSRRARLLDHFAGAAGDADLPPPARRHGDGHHLPDAPVLLHDQGPDPTAGRAIASSRSGGSAMFIELTPEQRQLQAELRQYFSNLISSDEMKAMEKDRHNEAYRAVIRRMGQDGKLGVGWPKEFGGLGFGPIEQSIFVNEAHRADVPLPAVTLQTVGPVLQQFGSDLQKKKFLPSILAGEVHFAIGYTEPEAGTDLASLRTTAVRHGDEYIVNGQKIFTTGAHDADYIWLACRTDPEAVKHKGISILIVDTKDPGYSWTPIILSDGAHHTNATYYNDVRVPADMLVGEENGGWRLITTQLNNERVMLGPAGRTAGIYDRLHDWASKPGGDGVTPIDHQDVKRALGEIYSMWRVNELLNWQVAAAGEDINVADAASTKVFGTESIQYIGRLAEEIVGKYGNPAESDDRRAAGMARLADQAQSGDHLRWRRERSDARDDRGVRPQSAEGASMTDIHEALAEIKAAGGRQAARRSRSGEPADDQQLGRSHRRHQPDLPGRGRRPRGRTPGNCRAAGHDSGVDDVRPGRGTSDRRSHGSDHEAVRRQRLHRRGRDELRADLPPVSAAR